MKLIVSGLGSVLLVAGSLLSVTVPIVAPEYWLIVAISKFAPVVFSALVVGFAPNPTAAPLATRAKPADTVLGAL